MESVRRTVGEHDVVSVSPDQSRQELAQSARWMLTSDREDAPEFQETPVAGDASEEGTP